MLLLSLGLYRMAIFYVRYVFRNTGNKPSSHEQRILYLYRCTLRAFPQTFQGCKMTTHIERYHSSSSLPTWFGSPPDISSKNLLNASVDDCDTFLGLISSISSSVIILQTSSYQNRSASRGSGSSSTYQNRLVSRGRYTFATYQNLESVNTSTAITTTRTMFSAAWSIILFGLLPARFRATPTRTANADRGARVPTLSLPRLAVYVVVAHFRSSSDAMKARRSSETNCLRSS